MYGPTKPAHWAILGFAAVALLVLSGLTWATIVSLRLEETTREAHARGERATNLEVALWLMDNQVWPTLGRELARPYYEYSSYYLPQTLHYSDGSEPAVDVLQESPLLDTSTLEPWIVLHFQYTDYEWTSPQIPSPDKWPQIEHAPLHDAAAHRREEQLRRLASAERFAEQFEKASVSPGRSIGEELVKIVEAPSLRKPGNLWQRAQQFAQLQQRSLPKVLECEPASNIVNVVGQQAEHPSGASDEGYEVKVGKLSYLWLNLADNDQPELVFVRRVRAGATVAFQGFMVDWRRLANTLTASVSDLYERISLEPVFSDSEVGDRATRLSTLPLRPVGAVPRASAAPAAWTSTRITVAFAWVAAVVALVAVGLGVRSLVALTSRRTEFTYAVTHELRTPLTTFQLYTDMLASGLVPEEKKPGYLRTLNEESKRLSDLVTEVLEFSRIESNAVRTNLGAYRVAELLDSIKARYASRCAAAGIALSLDANGSAERRLHTDLHIALQILGTLIDNACKYASAPAGRHGTVAAEPPCVRIAAYPGGRKLAIEVADNGPGIPPEDRHDLFQPFRRGSQAQKSKVGGVGLGLALAKRWSRLIHGNLELVDQGPRRGTCFRLTLPAE